ncbi:MULTISPECIES: ATP/GTP-binding protein [Lysinibacillus]|uniref:AAA family ATPase n=1 Tax=Lysinibacillus capsici TaxID=2115968 RepID=A0ABY8KF34_9BACI|nr:AAA family ATPase [Lysinibacillus capsici]WGF37745.1 AAA family ATPase [Lysinibacillus capsici]
MFYITSFRSPKNKVGFHLVPDNWNDYGYRTLYNLFYVDEKMNEHEIGHVKIGYTDEELASQLYYPFENLQEGLFSLGQGVSYYSNLRKLGDSVRLNCLIGLNDLAYYTDKYEKYKHLEIVRKSLMREMNIRNMEKQYRRVAHGGAVLTKYELDFPIQSGNGTGNFEFVVTPESFPPTNIHALIGTNGSGKTTTLKGIIKGYLSDSLSEQFSNAIFVSFSLFDKSIEYDFTDKSKEYYYVGVVNSLDSSIKSLETLNTEFNVSIQNLLKKNRILYLHRMIEILSTDNNIKNLGLLNIVEDFLEIDLEKKGEDLIKEHSLRMTQVFDTLSSGHKIILLTISKIVELVVEQSLIIIDEPETHLHPPLLSAFIRAISEIIIAENAVAIMATHSPVVLQEIPKSCAWIIRKHGSEMKIFRPRLETFGENIGVLTEEVFGLDIPKTGYHTLLQKVIEETNSYEDVLEKFNYELGIEAKSVIRTYINEKNLRED